MIRFYDAGRVFQPIAGELASALLPFVARGEFILGQDVQALEARIREELSVSCAVGTSSGTDGILASMMAANLGPGSEAICPAFTWISSATGALRLGASVRFADIHPCCFTLNEHSVGSLLTPRTRAVVAVDLFGQLANYEALQRILGSHPSFVLEDAAQAFGASIDGRKAGSFGDISVFSFFPTKNLPTMGDGGMVMTSNLELGERVRALRNHGRSGSGEHNILGGNFRLDGIQAWILLKMLAKAEARLLRRRQIAARYESILSRSAETSRAARTCLGEEWKQARLLLPSTCRGIHSFNQFVVRLSTPGDRDSLMAFLRERGIETRIYYEKPLHAWPIFRDAHTHSGPLPNAESASRELVALPIYPELEDAEVEHVASAVLSFLSS